MNHYCLLRFHHTGWFCIMKCHMQVMHILVTACWLQYPNVESPKKIWLNWTYDKPWWNLGAINFSQTIMFDYSIHFGCGRYLMVFQSILITIIGWHLHGGFTLKIPEEYFRILDHMSFNLVNYCQQIPPGVDSLSCFFGSISNTVKGYCILSCLPIL